MPYDGPYTSKPCGDSNPHDRHVYYINGWFQCPGVPLEVRARLTPVRQAGRRRLGCPGSRMPVQEQP